MACPGRFASHGGGAEAVGTGRPLRSATLSLGSRAGPTSACPPRLPASNRVPWAECQPLDNPPAWVA